MTMDYSLMSFEHFRHFLDFQDFGPKRCTIALCLLKIFQNFWKKLLGSCDHPECRWEAVLDGTVINCNEWGS